jgi:hypothetical protein
MQEPCQPGEGGNETHSHLARARSPSRKTLYTFKNPLTALKSIHNQKQSLTTKTRQDIIFNNWRKIFYGSRRFYQAN